MFLTITMLNVWSRHDTYVGCVHHVIRWIDVTILSVDIQCPWSGKLNHRLTNELVSRGLLGTWFVYNTTRASMFPVDTAISWYETDYEHINTTIIHLLFASRAYLQQEAHSKWSISYRCGTGVRSIYVWHDAYEYLPCSFSHNTKIIILSIA